MQVTITERDVVALNKFMLLHSKKAKKQKIVSTYAIAFEFLIFGIIIDGLFKTAPIASIASLIMGALWLVFFPKFYRKMLRKHIANAENIEPSSVVMNFLWSEAEISFANGEASASEKFATSDLNRIARSGENYFLGFERGFHIVLPYTEDTAREVENLAKFRNLAIESVDLNQKI
ncbi:hypothetical protein OFN97_07900 [Campylobacter sp. VBCF_05 NA6]|uniref:hypothetical protein n=1 Tax=unclassified Campylobacter TaxID=2593542 RepID=UPI0022E9AFAB|nr:MULTISPECIES: hypothetical protein [unclassified Campylobacter]MDA3058356.1 hypothetical protein [Campylobacter sp. VBCF_04 NA7]MDA3059926.1 hypothetical protein [Campylobacter sp. VBCF_05 NA6]